MADTGFEDLRDRFKKVALVHDWLFHMRGGEKVLEAIGEIFPNADIYTLFLNRKGLSDSLGRHTIKASWFNYIPGVKYFYKWLLPILPILIRRFNFGGYDLVISSSHCVAKGIKVPKNIPHVCYCHTPMRYAWFFDGEYFSHHKSLVRKVISCCMKYLRDWDFKTAQDVTQFIANSKNIALKINRVYEREAVVVHPPLDYDQFSLTTVKKDYYLVVSALVPYKRVDLAVQAFSELGKPLWVVGKGEELGRLQRFAGDNVKFFNWVPGRRLNALYGEAKALIFPGEEDFGIVPLEAQAAGTPVIAYGKGGALETIRDKVTGLFFDVQDSEALKKAVLTFESISWDSGDIRRATESFSEDRFKEEFAAKIREI